MRLTTHSFTVGHVPDRPRPIHTQYRRTFTLIERLVVIAISGILAGRIPAALAEKNGKALRLSCVNNLRPTGDPNPFKQLLQPQASRLNQRPIKPMCRPGDRHIFDG